MALSSDGQKNDGNKIKNLTDERSRRNYETNETKVEVLIIPGQPVYQI